jgi:hypothetical protein
LHFFGILENAIQELVGNNIYKIITLDYPKVMAIPECIITQTLDCLYFFAVYSQDILAGGFIKRHSKPC